MKLLVMAPAFFPDETIAEDRLWIYLRSCKKFEIIPHLYGIGTQRYPGLTIMRILEALNFLLRHQHGDYTHVLMTDAWDAFFVQPLETILYRYRQQGSPPILIAASAYCGNVQDVEASPWRGLFDTTLYYRYPGVFYIGEILAVMALLSYLKRYANTMAGDDYEPWLTAWKNGYPLKMDSQCEIFQDITGHCAVENGKLRNTHTGTDPCIFHHGGGFSHPQHGKDDRLIPWAKQLGVI